MNEFIFTREMLLIIAPLFFLQMGLVIYCGMEIFRQGVENLNRWAWFAICLFFHVAGPILFLLVGRRKEFK